MPPESIARRWAGALQARLARAPLEQFLQRNALKITYASGIKDTDNVARAVIFMVKAGVDRYARYYGDTLSEQQQSALAQSACAACVGVAQLIGCEATWRVSALLATTQLLAPYLGMTAAASRATFAVREFQDELLATLPAPELRGMSQRAADIVRRNESHFLDSIAWNLVRRLEARRTTALLPPARALLG